ncbi:hypothetical protein [Pseudohongiella sp. O18]|uniref:hypothetical protein n=1 Tax=Pseudohongiella sp. O18 TaxID=2904248 RepID=UPI001F192B6E|nr:hypothetical protein [Pseudohongiella sp. O18]
MSELTLKPEEVYESLSNASTGEWSAFRVKAIDGFEVFGRWIDGPDAGISAILDSDPANWRVPADRRAETLSACLAIVDTPEINRHIEASFALHKAVVALYKVGALKMPEASHEQIRV